MRDTCAIITRFALFFLHALALHAAVNTSERPGAEPTSRISPGRERQEAGRWLRAGFPPVGSPLTPSLH